MLARIRMRIDELQATTIRHDRASDRRNDPLELQLGKAPVYLVTNVLDPKELTNTDACRLYQLRWGSSWGSAR